MPRAQRPHADVYATLTPAEIDKERKKEKFWEKLVAELSDRHSDPRSTINYRETKIQLSDDIIWRGYLVYALYYKKGTGFRKIMNVREPRGFYVIERQTEVMPLDKEILQFRRDIVKGAKHHERIAEFLRQNPELLPL